MHFLRKQILILASLFTLQITASMSNMLNYNDAIEHGRNLLEENDKENFESRFEQFKSKLARTGLKKFNGAQIETMVQTTAIPSQSLLNVPPAAMVRQQKAYQNTMVGIIQTNDKPQKKNKSPLQGLQTIQQQAQAGNALYITTLNNLHSLSFADLQFREFHPAERQILGNFSPLQWATERTYFDQIPQEAFFHLYSLYQFPNFRSFIEKQPGFKMAIVSMLDAVTQSRSTSEKEFLKRIQEIHLGGASLIKTVFTQPSLLNYIEEQHQKLQNDAEFVQLEKQYENNKKAIALKTSTQKLVAIRQRQAQELVATHAKTHIMQQATSALLSRREAKMHKEGGQSCFSFWSNSFKTRFC